MMVRIIGESDSIEALRHYLLSGGITDIDTLDKIREFATQQYTVGDDSRKDAQRMLEKNRSFIFGAIGDLHNFTQKRV